MTGLRDRLNKGNEEEESIKDDLQESGLSSCVDWEALSDWRTLEEEQLCGGR